MTRIVRTSYGDQCPSGWCLHLMISGLCVMIGFAATDPTWGAENKFEGAYTGKRVLTKGSNQTCPAEDDVSVTIRGEALTFTNSRHHNYSMGFEPHPDGSFNEISAGVEGEDQRNMNTPGHRRDIAALPARAGDTPAIPGVK